MKTLISGLILFGLLILGSVGAVAQAVNPVTQYCVLSATGYCPAVGIQTGLSTLKQGVDTHNVYINPVGTPGTISVLIQGSVIGDFTDAVTCGTSTTTTANLLSCSGIYATVRVQVSTFTGFTSVGLFYVGTSSVAKSGGGTLSASGTPLVHQPAVWVDATHIKGITNGTTGQCFLANTGADPGFGACPGGASERKWDLLSTTLQGAGCSWNMGTVAGSTTPTPLVQSGGTTTVPQCFPLFTTAGALGTGQALYIQPTTIPSGYTTNANIVLTGAIGDHVDTTGTATFTTQYVCQAVPGPIQPALSSTTYGTGAVTVSGTIDNSVVITVTITPNTGGSPACAAGNQFSGVIYLSAKTATNPVYLSQLYTLF